MFRGGDVNIGFIGCGRMGSALAIALHAAGYNVTSVSSLHYESAAALAKRIPGCRAYAGPRELAKAVDTVFITTPDDAITPVCESITWQSGQSVVHCSGADAMAALSSAGQNGAETGVLHPLQTFNGSETGENPFAGVTFAVEAGGDLYGVLADMAKRLGGRTVNIPAHLKALYHISAVMASNYLVVLAGMSAALWQNWGICRDDALQALLPLIKKTVSNLETAGINASLTGPVARGDAGTLQKHLAALDQYAAGIEPLYRQLGLQAVTMGLAKGSIDATDAEKLRGVLKSNPPEEIS